MDLLVANDKLAPLITKLTENTTETTTVTCQVTLKNYDFKKDVRFDSNCILPHPKRSDEKICVIADKNLEEACVSNNIPFVTFEEVQGSSIEKKRLKKGICDKYHSFISLPTYNRYFELRILAGRNKPVYLIRNAADLMNTYNNALTTVKFKLKKSVNLHFPVGHTGLTHEQLSENIGVVLNHLFGLLKRGLQNIDSIYIKTTYGLPVKLFGK